jgi:hypothetical protein
MAGATSAFCLGRGSSLQPTHTNQMKYIASVVCIAFAGCESTNHPHQRSSTHRYPLQNPPAQSSATDTQSLPAVDLRIPADWSPHTTPWTPVYGAAANGDIDEARRRVAHREGSISDIQYGWADYLSQQQRIRTWTPVVIATGIAALDAMSTTPAERPIEDRDWRVIQHRQEADAAAEREGRSKPYGY